MKKKIICSQTRKENNFKKETKIIIKKRNSSSVTKKELKDSKFLLLISIWERSENLQAMKLFGIKITRFEVLQRKRIPNCSSKKKSWATNRLRFYVFHLWHRFIAGQRLHWICIFSQIKEKEVGGSQINRSELGCLTFESKFSMWKKGNMHSIEHTKNHFHIANCFIFQPKQKLTWSFEEYKLKPSPTQDKFLDF